MFSVSIGYFSKLLDDVYRTKKNVDLLERLLLVRRGLVDNEHLPWLYITIIIVILFFVG